MRKASVFLGVAGLALLLGCLSALNAVERNGIAWHTNIDSAWRAMQDKQQPILLFVTMDSCTYCRKMYRDTMVDRGVVNDVQLNYVAAYVNGSDIPNIVEKLGVKAYPTVAIISPDAQVVDLMVGYLPPQQFRGRLANATKQLADGRTASR